MKTRLNQADEDFLVCHDDRCTLMAEDFMDDDRRASAADKFNRVIADLVRVYPNAILCGAVAAAKYIRHPVESRETHDVDILLDEKDFAEFLIDDIPKDTIKKLEMYFEDSDSTSHSLRHKETGVYIDLLSTESPPIRKKIARHILNNRQKTTHVLQDENHAIDILKPELLIAMKMNRYCKNLKTQRGFSDRLDIVKIIKTLTDRQIPIDHDMIKGFLNPMEIKKYDDILDTISEEESV